MKVEQVKVVQVMVAVLGGSAITSGSCATAGKDDIAIEIERGASDEGWRPIYHRRRLS